MAYTNIALACLIATQACGEQPVTTNPIVWGTATAAYQIEGHRDADGRQPSIWDAFDTAGRSQYIKANKPNGDPNILRQQNAARADDDYLRYKESIDLANQLGFGAMRMSVSWPRVMTYSILDGALKWVRNQAGIDHYKELLASYKAAGLKVALTMFHWDMPLVIEDFAHSQNHKSAWLCHEWIGERFKEYAQLLIQEYSSMVEWWITINEPLTVTSNGYTSGTHAPGRCSNRDTCYFGDSTTEPYQVAKGLLLGHGNAFQAWKEAGSPGTGCGITLSGDWKLPMTDSAEDVAAQQRSLEWQAATFADPIHFGKWPDSMVKIVGGRLPTWSTEELAIVKGSHDDRFYMNHYTTTFVKANPDTTKCGWDCDQMASTSGYNFTSKEPIGTPSSNGWLFNYGPGLGKLMSWYNDRYPGLSFVVTENGWGNATQADISDELDDEERCSYYRDYIGNMSAVVAREGIKFDAYFAWSLMDNYEWADGFTTRFGLTYVDYETQKRTLKMSSEWFRQHITSLRSLPTDGKPLPECPKPRHAETAIVL